MQRIDERISKGFWVLFWLALLVGGAVLGGNLSATAAPPNQTIPQRTPTAPATAVPTVTSTSEPAPATNTPAPTNTPGSGDQPATATSQPGAPGATSTPTPTPQPTHTPTLQSTATTIPDFALQAEMGLVAGVAMQGQTVELRLIVRNPGAVAAQNVTARDELPKSLELVAVDAVGGTTATETTQDGKTVVLVTWSSLAPGGEAQATLTVRIASNVADGVVIDNLAVAFADNAGPVTTGISIGTPPLLLPTFN